MDRGERNRDSAGETGESPAHQWRKKERPEPYKAAIVHISDDGLALSHDRDKDLIDFPGGGTKFTIRFDPKTQRYWSIANKQTDPPAFRNVLVLTSSPDLRNWNVETILLRHADSTNHAWQYVDWQFAGDDLVAVSRTAWDGAHRAHDANYFTFHRFAKFRQLTMADSTPWLGQAESETTVPAAKATHAEQPNILFICTDDQAAWTRRIRQPRELDAEFGPTGARRGISGQLLCGHPRVQPVARKPDDQPLWHRGWHPGFHRHAWAQR